MPAITHLNKKVGMLAALLILVCSNCRKSEFMVDREETVRDSGSGTGTVIWTADRSYVLEGLVFVNDGQVLTIEAGTVIRARTGQGTAASALIVARGGKIFAMGTPAEPIIFTCEGDDLRGSVPVKARGLWGGLIILGNAGLNSRYNENSIEGIPISEPRGIYGGSNDEDDSGIIRYVSIRHGGTNIGEGNEINGLTLGGVGSGTTIEHVEVISNADDGFEFFGGTVQCKYLIAAFCGDDAFDYDEGFRGKGQFWIGVQDKQEGSLLLEANGGSFPENGRPLSSPELFNLTLVGSGMGSSRKIIEFSRNAAGSVCNSIMVNQTEGVVLEYKAGLEDSYGQFKNGKLQLRGNVFYDVANNDTAGIFRVFSEDMDLNLENQNMMLRAYFLEAFNKVENPGISFSGGEFQLVAKSYFFTGIVPYPSSWFDQVSYQGAFGTYNWASEWTLISRAGILTDE